MIHNKNFVPILLSIVSATTGISLSKQAVTANASSGDWTPCPGQAISIEDVDNGIKLENTSGWGVRAYHKEKITIDGLSFDWTVENLANNDCRGFAFHSNGLPYDYFSDAGFQPSSVFTAWQIWDQSRFYIGSTHDYNQTPINYADTTKTNVGFSNAGGHLIMTRSENYTLNFAFEKVDDTWYKITMKATNVTMWQANNYGTDIKNNSIVTYITADDLKVDENGKAWLITVAMAKQNADLSDTVYFLNMNYQTGIEASISKSEYKVNEDLDLSGLTVSKIFKNGNKTEIDPSKVTISGYNKKS